MLQQTWLSPIFNLIIVSKKRRNSHFYCSSRFLAFSQKQLERFFQFSVSKQNLVLLITLQKLCLWKCVFLLFDSITVYPLARRGDFWKSFCYGWGWEYFGLQGADPLGWAQKLRWLKIFDKFDKNVVEDFSRPRCTFYQIFLSMYYNGFPGNIGCIEYVFIQNIGV